MKSFEYTAIKILEKYNFTREDAEAFLETIKEAKSDENSTKSDIRMVEERIAVIEREIQAIKLDIKSMDAKIETGKYDIIKWMAGFMLAQIALITGLVKLLFDK